jgi:membrane-associated phospholipid phosphatase
MAHNRLANVDRRVLRASIAAAGLCLVTFLILRLLLLLLDGPSPLDVWLAEHIRQPNPSQGIKILERLIALPGSRKGAAALILGVGAWAWFRRGDLRPGALLLAAFVATVATIEILKALIVRVMPIAPSGEPEDRAFLSSHVAIAVAVLGMLVVVIGLSGRRDLLRPAVPMAIVAVSAVAVSLMAADMHYLVDILSGAAVAGFWVSVLALVGHLIWTRPRAPTSPAPSPELLELGEDRGSGSPRPTPTAARTADPGGPSR